MIASADAWVEGWSQAGDLLRVPALVSLFCRDSGDFLTTTDFSVILLRHSAYGAPYDIDVCKGGYSTQDETLGTRRNRSNMQERKRGAHPQQKHRKDTVTDRTAGDGGVRYDAAQSEDAAGRREEKKKRLSYVVLMMGTRRPGSGVQGTGL
ncbi:hypothetical protein CPLU01_05283 [Colletotrichum plurivorum]|uniref:Uncharacterized protein n=1 Tax=Colletotrichum plurivorum TaxID=2175906 RepID=A0A8H6KM88_9PEZI|nr:hypothetical protein CPLU01_05283 [Colletotrichum plurivorum]